MGKVMVIGCGGVAGGAIRKCCANSRVFDEVCIACLLYTSVSMIY